MEPGSTDPLLWFASAGVRQGSEMFDLGSVPYKDSDELCMACGLSAHTLSVQKGSLRYPALFEFAAVLHNEMDVIAASNKIENGPQTGVSLTYGG